MYKLSFLRQFRGFFISSLKIQLRNRVSLFLTFFFPIVFITIFGFLNINIQSSDLQLGLLRNESVAYSDLRTPLVSSDIEIEESDDENLLIKRLEKNKIDGYLKFGDNKITLVSNPVNDRTNEILQTNIENILKDETLMKESIIQDWDFVQEGADVESSGYIDYLLPGVLGLIILIRAVSATSFNLVNIRGNSSLKRIFAAPVSKLAFVMGNAFSRIIFTFTQVVVIIFIAWGLFDTGPKEEWAGIGQMLILVFLGLVLFLGLGYIIAAVSKKDSLVNSLSAIFIYPQILLCATFFPIDQFPEWLQMISSYLPLYNLNQGLRYIFLDGMNIWDRVVLIQTASLAVWTVIVYVVSSQILKRR